ncbi:MAG: hypothetical protein R3C28_26990 [Pirellulaceae bacterium]
MFARHHDHVAMEMVKWLVVFALASALVLVATRPVEGVDFTALPTHWGTAVDEPLAAALDETAEAGIWLALDYHHRGMPTDAVVAWHEAAFREDAEVWRFVCMGMARFELAQFPEAAADFEVALDLDKTNAVAWYGRGLTLLLQSRQLGDWADAVATDDAPWHVLRAFDYQPNVDRTMTASLVRHQAKMAFENAVWFAQHLDRTMLLTDANRPVYALGDMMVVVPNVSDVLTALKLDQFPAQPHAALTTLYLEDNMLTTAETHLDQMDLLGVPVAEQFRVLGDRYEKQAEHHKAVKAYLKAMKNTKNLAYPAAKALDSMLEDLLD